MVHLHLFKQYIWHLKTYIYILLILFKCNIFFYVSLVCIYMAISRGTYFAYKNNLFLFIFTWDLTSLSSQARSCPIAILLFNQSTTVIITSILLEWGSSSTFQKEQLKQICPHRKVFWVTNVIVNTLWYLILGRTFT